MKMSKLFVAAVLAVLLALPVSALAAEVNLGGGTPLWDTHTDDDNTHFDGGWLIFASIDRPTEAKPWLSYGLMYNYTRIKVGVEDIKTETGQTQIDPPDLCFDSYDECGPRPTTLNGFNGHVETTTTIKTNHDWLQIHVLGPYAKPTWQMTKRLKAFTMVGAGLMYVDGPIYGDEFGGAGFASAGLTFDLYKNVGLTGQLLYVKGFTSHVDDVDYLAPVVSFKFEF